ncbi:MAG TPA: AAA family ATPase, partial [Conexibacter sp.]|nr:AAA family ATPase [Conexibacter sp.]
VALRETHASWVVLAGERAFKVKKPLRFAFLDQSTLPLRRAACEAELALNRELAPDLYLAVRALVPAARDGALQLASAGAADAIEYAVEMRRFDESATLAGLARRGPLEDRHLRAVARRLAAFHAAAPIAADAPATAAAAAAGALRLLDRNAEELIELLDGAANAAGRAAVAAQTRAAAAFATGHAGTLAARAADGHVRELHGDLRAEHVLPGPPVAIVDRLEFNRAWREIDVADELAFLAMDLTALGQPAAAQTLLAAYRDAGGDLGDARLLPFHAIYRAHVRAKVTLLRAAQETGTARVAARAAASALIAVAERFAWQLRLPRLLVVCGVSATGKSRLAAELARRSGRPAISSDTVRKRLVGIAATARAGGDAYTPAVSERTYAELGRAALAAGRAGAIVDATFRRTADRAAFAAELGEHAADVVHVELTAPATVLETRARRRLAEPDRVSDATPEVVRAQAGSFEPLADVPPHRHHLLRSDRSSPRIADALAAALDGTVARSATQ